ncbi:DUF1934 domain-containing protein [Periweissella beninensis]|uniref:DUF1934 domain-containing protein n=1 Tax=Periweissella beninensis TaxID=504936 RepID=A0ABT0VJI0_9LACO|nr:DUF1934 domain-containing protein [Periweissella beninensis]MBM7543971.1 uncharacterized beta-barrel protein YwiB (DUF1934 family) [Periweissella beninensis]MCM2437981.1 DUF1934 domain-containing protein [Periweissella beninensis]MCT4395693.1 DUF1934 domain-containing protein [Periweissella beninensis]
MVVRQSTGVPIKINLTTTIKQPEQSEKFTFSENGQAVYIGDTLYLRYQESAENGTKVPVTMKIKTDNTIQLRRHGQADLRLLFDVNNKGLSKYRTPAGLLDIMVSTKRLISKIEQKPLNGQVIIDYDLAVGGQYVGNYNIQLQFAN